MPQRTLSSLSQFLPARGRRLRPLLLVALAMACLARAPGAQAEPAAGWWSAFHDATLNLLLASAVPTAAAEPQDPLLPLQRQADATAAYVLARVASVRLMNGQLLIESLQREVDLLGADGQEASEPARAARQALDAARARQSQFEALRASSIALLAQRSGADRSVAMLTQQLAPALGDARLPMPSFDLPREMPGIVLRQRPDVAQAEVQLAQSGRDTAAGQLRLARYLQALSAPIAADANVQDGGGAAAPQAEDVLEGARRDIARKLGRLAVAVNAAKAQEALLLGLQPDYLALRERFRRGEVPEVQALQGLARMLLEEDRLAAVGSNLALAWIAFQASIGGAGRASTSDLLGATREE